MRKQIVAFLSAFIITAIVALTMLVVGVNAATNPNSVAAVRPNRVKRLSWHAFMEAGNSRQGRPHRRRTQPVQPLAASLF